MVRNEPSVLSTVGNTCNSKTICGFDDKITERKRVHIRFAQCKLCKRSQIVAMKSGS